jgi:hypothetical protein
MPAVELALCLLSMVLACALSFGLSMLGQLLGQRFRPDRVSRKDQRWLAAQEIDPHL